MQSNPWNDLLSEGSPSTLPRISSSKAQDLENQNSLLQSLLASAQLNVSGLNISPLIQSPRQGTSQGIQNPIPKHLNVSLDRMRMISDPGVQQLEQNVKDSSLTPCTMTRTRHSSAPDVMLLHEPSDHSSTEEDVQKSKSLTKKKREINRLASRRSRQRKKEQWEELHHRITSLLDENQALKVRIAELENIVLITTGLKKTI